MAVVKNLMVRCGADFSGLTKATKRAQVSMGAMQKSATVLKSAMRSLGLVVGAAAMIGFGKSCIKAASDLEEVQNVVDVTFGSMSSQINQFASNAIESFGMSEKSAKQYTGTMGAMLKSMGLSTSAAAGMSIKIAGLAGDLASFYNLSSDDAFAKIRSGISGETEPLKQLGINMSVANMQAYALSQGMKKSYASMTQAEQATLRYNYLMHATADAQGDFARTSGSWANQTRILSERFNQLKTSLGQGLIQALAPALQMLNRVMASLVSLAKTFSNVTAAIFGKQTAAVSANADATTSAADAQGALADGVTAAGKAAKASVAGFDDLNVLQKDSGSGGGGAPSGSGGPAIDLLDAGGAAESPIESEISGMMGRITSAILPAKQALSGLWEQLKIVGSFTSDALITFYEKFLLPVGGWVIGEGFTRFVEAITNGLSNVNFANINESLQTLWEKLAPFAVNVGAGLLWLWENVFVPWQTWAFNNTVPLFLDILAGALDVANAAIEALKPLGQWLWDNFLQPVAVWTGGVIVDVLQAIKDGLTGVSDWISGHAGDIESITIIVGSFAAAWGLVNAAVGIWNVMGAVATGVTTAFGAAVNFLMSPIGAAVIAIGTIIAVVVLLAKHWDEVKEAASNCWDGIKEAFSKAGTWLTEKVITPIVNGFKTFVNGLIGMVESFVNFFVDGINFVIEALNKIKIDIPDWVPLLGGKTFGFSLNAIGRLSIPRLATGGIVTSSTLANIGEAGKEAVLPLENNTGWMDELADRIGGNIIIQASGGAGLMKYLNLELSKDSARRGKNLIVGGAY